MYSFFDTPMGAAPEVADTVYKYSVLGRQGLPAELKGAFLVSHPVPSPASAETDPPLACTAPRLGCWQLHHRRRLPRRRRLHALVNGRELQNRENEGTRQQQ